MQKETKIILPDDPTAATYETNIEGWVSRERHFYGKQPGAEERARLDGSTHIKCPTCGSIRDKTYAVCDTCYRNKKQQQWEEMEFQAWDCTTPLVLFDGDKYFFDQDDIEQYLEDINESSEVLMESSDLRLVICKANYLGKINYDWWSDELPEGRDLEPEVVAKIDELNKFLSEQPPVSWSASKFKTRVFL